MSELIDSELGLYRIEEVLGTGGMSTVFKAYHAALDRHVALKVLPEQMGADAELRQRFQQEVRVIARLEHAHILPIYDYGQDRGRLYLVMRYIETGTLEDRLAQGPMDLGEVSRVMHQVGSALDHAHRHGIVHRDIKPSNVLIDAQGDCYLGDFGLARTVEASVRLTSSGMAMGTPAYMSPEQAKGEKVDARSDVYSLGAMLYEMTTGRAPYEGNSPTAVAIKHILDPVPLPRRINPGLPEEVERVIVKAMAKDPKDRFQSVGEMVETLGAAVTLTSQPVMLLPGGLDRRRKTGPAMWERAIARAALLVLIVLGTLLLPGAFAGGRVGRQATKGDTERPGVASELPRAAAFSLAATAPAADPPVTPRLTPTPSSALTSSPTPVPTATSSPTYMPTATVTHTPTASPVPTETPTHTPTASLPPTHTPTLTPTHTPRPTATPTVRWMPAPELLAPPDGASYVGWNAEVYLRWSEVQGMLPDEYYVVRIPYDDAGGVAEFWRQETVLRVPSVFSSRGVGFPDRHYAWTVQLMRCTGNCARVLEDDARKQGVAVGSESAARVFYWQPDIGGSPVQMPTLTRPPLK
jgi:serine/threonine protein kinase